MMLTYLFPDKDVKFNLSVGRKNRNSGHLRLYRPERDEITREWRKVPNKELHHLYSFPN
jgi:hypothetical protein